LTLYLSLSLVLHEQINRIGDEGVEALVSSPIMRRTQLTNLDLHVRFIPLSIINSLALHWLMAMMVIVVWNNQRNRIEDRGAQSIAELLRTSPSLTKLNLWVR